MTERDLSTADRRYLQEHSWHVFEGLRWVHRELVAMEVEGFLLHPRHTTGRLFPETLRVSRRDDEALVTCGEWELRYTLEGRSWNLTRIARRCQACQGSGTCPGTTHSEACTCVGTGLCTRCNGLGNRLFFS
jgi:hypothetical protein